MLFPLLVAFVSVALGTAFALAAHSHSETRSVRWIRWVAIVAAVGVIAVHLVPEAFQALGARSLAAFAGGILLPAAFERGVAAVAQRREHRHGHEGALATLEMGYAGLVAHRFGDGLSMGAYYRASSSSWAGASVVLALAAHIVPVTMVMILAVLSLRGRRSAVFRGVGLAASTMAGVVAAGAAVPMGPEGRLSAWISAAVAGLLLHIVIHDVPHRHHEPAT